MKSRITKLIGWLLTVLMVFNALLFVDSKAALAICILLSSIVLLVVIFGLFSVEIKEVEKNNAGILHVLEKSEAGRISAEEFKNKILLMIDDLSEGILIIGKDDKISVINSRAEKFLSVSRKQLLNKSVLDLGHLSSAEKLVFPLLFNFRGAHKSEIEVRQNLILELSIEPLVLGKNNTAKLVILKDITKEKNSELSRNQFILVAAHQLKSPLAATRLSLKMLLAKNFGKITKRQKDVLEKTYKNNESLIYLVEDLLSEAKNGEDGQTDNRVLVNLEDLVLPVVDFYRDELKRKKIDFKFNKQDGEILEVLADPEKVKMVIQNLFDNAVKYTPPKGKIEVSIKEAASGRASPSKGRELEFSIKDSGIGIPEDQKDKIFARFSRADNAVAGKASGSGLGLAIAKDIIEKHRGKIWFQSKENKGATFFFSLPLTSN